MVKTTLYLPDSLKASIERLAKEEGRSEAELLREAVRELVASRQPPRPRLPLFAALGDPTIAERADEILAAGFGRD